MKEELPIQIRLLDPPRDARFGVQHGRTEIVAPTQASPTEIRFDLSLRVGNGRADGLPNFLGPFAQGPPSGRFVYVNSGTLAGQSDSCWTRRAKVHLAGITWAIVEAVCAGTADVVEARIAGTGRDGGPACATVPLVDGGWRATRSGEIGEIYRPFVDALPGVECWSKGSLILVSPDAANRRRGRQET